MRNEETPRSVETSWVTITAVGILGLLLAYNVSGFFIERHGASSFHSLPPATHRAGYLAFVGEMRGKQYDFRVYEALRRRFDGAELIGYDEDAISFGGYDQLAKQFGRRTFAGFISETVTAYDPVLSSEEAHELRRVAVEVISATEHLPGAVVVAPPGGAKSSARVLVLRGADDTRFYVSGSLVPERYAGVANGS